MSPAKADSPLIIDADTVLSSPLASEFLQPVARRYAQVVQIVGAVEHLQLSFSLCTKGPEPSRRTAVEKFLGVARSKRPDHLLHIV